MGNNLGEFLTEGNKKEVIKKYLVQNHILHTYIDFIKDPHNKFFVVLNPCPEYQNIGILFINSTVNLNVNKTAALKALQHKILKKDYTFLDHDSWVDCSQIKEFPHANMLEKYIKESKDFYKGILNNYDSMTILSIVQQSNTHSPKQKKKYGLN